VSPVQHRDKIIIGSIQLAVIAALLGAWYIASHSSQQMGLFLPAPERVWTAFQAVAASGQLWTAAKITLLTILQAYVIAAVAGVAVGFLVARSERLLSLFEPMLSGMFAIPITMFFPLFILFFGLGPQSKIAYGATYAFFPIALNTIAGFASVDRLFLRAIRSLGASPLQQLRYVYLPGALPVIVTGLRIGFFICIASVLGGETLASVAGIGRSIALSAELMETARMYAWIVFVVMVTLILNLLVYAAESRMRRDA
jgi:ABC-type nitrate/sulfonate/bicarbonate transport system permease component